MAQPVLLSHMGPEGDHHRAFIAWAQYKKGVKINGIEPANFPGAGMGMIATRKIIAGETLVFAPTKSLLTVDPDARRADAASRMSVHGRLALLLLDRSEVAEEALSTKPWMRAMPKQDNVFAGLPLKWDLPLQQCLTPGGILLYEKQRKKHDADVAAFRALFLERNGQQATHEQSSDTVDGHAQAFSHAWILVNSRSFYWDYPRKVSVKNRRSKKRPRDDCVALCPFMDYFNHVSHQDCVLVEYNATGYTLKADRDYESGEELNISYGSHSNDFLMVEYGFVLDEPPNLCDHAALDKYIRRALTESQQEALKLSGLLDNYILDRDGTVCHRTQCAVRAILLPPARLDKFIYGTDDGASDQATVDAYLLNHVLLDFDHDVHNAQACIDSNFAKWTAAGRGYAARMLKTRYRQLQAMLEAAKTRLAAT